MPHPSAISIIGNIWTFYGIGKEGFNIYKANAKNSNKNGILVKNSCSKPIFVALRIATDGGWLCRYWHEIQPGDTALLFEQKLASNYIYLHAFNEESVWGEGDYIDKINGEDISFTRFDIGYNSPLFIHTFKLSKTLEGIYQEKIQNIYHAYLKPSKAVRFSFEKLCGEAGKVYSEIQELNRDPEFAHLTFHDKYAFDSTLVFYIAGYIKENIANKYIADKNQESLADEIGSRIIEYINGQKKGYNSIVLEGIDERFRQHYCDFYGIDDSE